MHITRLYIEGFRGIDKREIKLNPGLNILRGRRCSGKTSVVDSLLFLQRFSISPSRSLENLLHTWFTYAVVHRSGNKFTVAVETNGEDEEKGVFGLTGDVKGNSINEFYVVKDTIVSMKMDSMEISSIFLSRASFLEEVKSRLGENIWSRISKKRIKYKRVPWKTIAGLVWSEITHYGFEIAYKKIPEAIATILVNRAVDLSKEERETLKPRLAEILRYAFKINRFLRRSVVAKHIDYKNAIGPSKLRGHSIDPHFSNLPWILYNMYRVEKHGGVIDCLSRLGVRDGLHGIDKTVDHRYYIVVSSQGREIMREGIATSFVKSLALCTAINYAEELVVVDDFDEYLDEELAGNFLRLAVETSKQVILTTRRSSGYLGAGFKSTIIDIG